MIRRILEELLVFSVPFAVFALVLLALRRNPLQREHWEPQFFRLVLAGSFLVVASLVLAGLTAKRHGDGYQPPRLENGRIVPGHFE